MSARSELRRQSEDILARQQQPFHLAAVCWQWRAAAFAFSAVWAHLELSLDKVTEETSSVWTAFLETCSERSKQAPLTIRLRRHRGSEPYDDQLLAILISRMPRCIAFHLDMSRMLSDDSLSALLSVSADNLQSARLYMEYPAEWDGQPFPDSPLRELYIAHTGRMSLDHNYRCNMSFRFIKLTLGEVDATRFFAEVLRRRADLQYPLIGYGPNSRTRASCDGLNELHDDAAFERLVRLLDQLKDLSLDGTEQTTNPQIALCPSVAYC